LRRPSLQARRLWASEWICEHHCRARTSRAAAAVARAEML